MVGENYTSSQKLIIINQNIKTARDDLDWNWLGLLFTRYTLTAIAQARLII